MWTPSFYLRIEKSRPETVANEKEDYYWKGNNDEIKVVFVGTPNG